MCCVFVWWGGGDRDGQTSRASDTSQDTHIFTHTHTHTLPSVSPRLWRLALLIRPFPLKHFSCKRSYFPLVPVRESVFIYASICVSMCACVCVCACMSVCVRACVCVSC